MEAGFMFFRNDWINLYISSIKGAEISWGYRKSQMLQFCLGQFVSNFPELRFWLPDKYTYTDEEKILLAKYQKVVDELIKKHPPRQRESYVLDEIKPTDLFEVKDGIFTRFYDFTRFSKPVKQGNGKRDRLRAFENR